MDANTLETKTTRGDIAAHSSASVVRGEQKLASLATAASKPTSQEQHQFGSDAQWTVNASQGLMADTKQSELLCKELGLPQLPEMVFLSNQVHICHKGQKRISFNAKDALQKVSLTPDDNIKVAATQKWREARKDSEYINREVLKFDWTFTTDYHGTFFDIPHTKIRDAQNAWEVFDVEKLSRRDPILFYQDMILFEDELSDNGCALLGVKLRAMKSCFLLLMRFYLRVDDVIVRVIDSRLYTEPSWNIILWEFTKRESSVADLRSKDISYSDITKADVIASKLSILHQETKVIELT